MHTAAHKNDIVFADTAAGYMIDNKQDREISTFVRNQFPAMRATVHPASVLRSSETPRYNCHGMVFASRRTNITKHQQVFRILAEDDYRLVDESDLIPGDVAVYLSELGEVEHSAIVTSVGDGVLRDVTVVSKWGCYGEYLHPLRACPYATSLVRYYRVTP